MFVIYVTFCDLFRVSLFVNCTCGHLSIGVAAAEVIFQFASCLYKDCLDFDNKTLPKNKDLSIFLVSCSSETPAPLEGSKTLFRSLTSTLKY